MSTLMSPLKAGARARVPRFAEAAVERARLTVVPQRSLGRTQAARTPFAAFAKARSGRAIRWAIPMAATPCSRASSN